ncbi:hypothetical protein NPIL_340061 [Nephila pilipes]|uniref:Uncharacterized protein n=1 Tax=Nephila pilipes TaxID=299642 RepID=A0A8X6QLG4_NEPPI|nr:hypothetical protein NPIL_340061 [Nephila pilipes]
MVEIISLQILILFESIHYFNLHLGNYSRPLRDCEYHVLCHSVRAVDLYPDFRVDNHIGYRGSAAHSIGVQAPYERIKYQFKRIPHDLTEKDSL